MSTLTISKKLIKINKEPVVIMPLKRWQAIESELEDLEMYRSVNLPREIVKRRKEKSGVSLEKILKKYRV